MIKPRLVVPWNRGRQRRWKQLHLRAVEPTSPCPATTVDFAADAHGLHVRFRCVATAITATMANDGDPLWLEDVVELFLCPKPKRRPCWYLEHEISPRGRALTLLVAADGGACGRWAPWGLSDAQRPRQRVKRRDRQGRVTGWSADLTIPWSLLSTLGAGPPRVGDRWLANVARIDQAGGSPRHAIWGDSRIADFHRQEMWGELCFASQSSTQRNSA